MLDVIMQEMVTLITNYEFNAMNDAFEKTIWLLMIQHNATLLHLYRMCN